MKKWLKITLIVIGSILLLLLLALLLVSPIAKSYVNKHGKDLIGRELHVETLKVNLFKGQVRIYDLSVYEDDDKTVFFHFDTLDAAVKLRKLLGSELYVKHFTLANPKVRVLQEGDRFNFNSIIEHFASDEPDKPEDTTSSSWKLGFYNIRLTGGEVYYADAGSGSEWDLKNLNIKIPGVYFDGSENTDAGVELQLADGGVLRTDASLNLDDNSFVVNLDLEKFAISNIRAYLNEVVRLSKLGGELNAKVKAQGKLDEILKMNISGNVALQGVDIRDLTGDQVLACNRLAVDVKRINIEENLFDIKTVSVDQLKSHFDRYTTGTNFDRLFPSTAPSQKPPEEEKADDQPSSPSKPFQLKVGSFALKDAAVTYNDFTLPDRFSFPITKLNITSENLSFSGENNAKVFAQLPHGGMAIIRWKGNIDDWKANQYLSLTIKSLHLKDLSPYAVAYLAFPFTDGTLSFTSENTIVNSQLDGKNRLDLYNPEVGEKREDVKAEVNVPLKAALFVLKDKDGKVQFDIPVKGNIDSPEFSYMKIVWKTLGNLLVKVATSPFRLMANAFGGAGNMDFIVTDPLQAGFTAEQYNLYAKIAEVLNYDSSIVIALEPQFDMAAAVQAQRLYSMKEEYYLSIHPEKSYSAILPQFILYDDVSAISVKDTGFVSYLRSKGLKSRRPSEKEVRRFAEQHYSEEAATIVLQNVFRMRDEGIRRYFVEKMGVSEKQISIGELSKVTKKNGYEIKILSDVQEPETEN